MVANAILILVGFSSSVLLVYLVLHVVKRQNLLAHPNHRSSHDQPTPTMGGIGIAVVGIVYLGVLFQQGVEHLGWWLGALLTLALVGAVDDMATLSRRVRLVVQIVCCGAVLTAMPDTVRVVFGLEDSSGVFATVGFAFLLVGLLWFVNLFNFMDGIDGYAAMQALLFCVGCHVVHGLVPGWLHNRQSYP